MSNGPERNINTSGGDYREIKNSGYYAEGNMNISHSSQGSSPQPQQAEHNSSSHISPAERGIALGMAVAVLGTLIILVLYPRALESQTMAIVRFIAASFAGIAGYLFSGTLDVRGKIPLTETQFRAAGGFAAFIVVFLLFFYGVPTFDQ